MWYTNIFDRKSFTMIQKANLHQIPAALDSRAPKLVITHKNCMDGCVCKALWREHLVGKSAQFIELDYAQIKTDAGKNARRMHEFFMGVKEHDVMISDFALPLEWMQALSVNNRSLTWMDHHESAKLQLHYFLHEQQNGNASNVSIVFDEDNAHSGALLTHMGITPDVPASELVRLVSDADVWRFEYGDRTRHLHQGFMSEYGEPKDIPMSLLQQALSDPTLVQRWCQKGAPEYEKYLRQVADYAQYAKPIRLDGIDGWMVHVPKMFVSDVGAYLAQNKGGFALMYAQDTQNNVLKCSLRSSQEELTGVGGVRHSMNTLAARFGGGGHKKAAAFVCSSFEALMQFNELKPSTPKAAF